MVPSDCAPHPAARPISGVVTVRRSGRLTVGSSWWAAPATRTCRSRMRAAALGDPRSELRASPVPPRNRVQEQPGVVIEARQPEAVVAGACLRVHVRRETSHTASSTRSAPRIALANGTSNSVTAGGRSERSSCHSVGMRSSVRRVEVFAAPSAGAVARHQHRSQSHAFAFALSAAAVVVLIAIAPCRARNGRGCDLWRGLDCPVRW